MGLIFDVQRFCIHDGPGIRTTVFFKGCPLRCKWCSNPESQSMATEFMFSAERCIGCGSCKAACPVHAPYSDEQFSESGCVHCGKCTDACPTEALIAKGQEVSVQELMERILRDRTIYKASGGGVTFSGGEPLCQANFLWEMLSACKEAGIATCIETTLYASWHQIEPCIPLLDHVFCDVKHTDPVIHQAWTGVSCQPIIENIRRLAETDRTVVFRIPVIPGFNTTPEAHRGFLELFDSIPPHDIELLPYHIYGEGKYRMLKHAYLGADIPTEQARPAAEALARFLRNAGHTVSIRG